MKSLKPLVASAFIVLTACLVFLSTASAASFPVFGEKVYVRANGKPTAEVDNFNVANTQRTYTLRVFNGGRNNEFNRVSSAIILLNGTQILGPNDFNQNVGLIERPVTIFSTNTLSVELRSKPGSALAVIIVGDNTPPQIVSTPITTAKENDPYRYDVDATDPDPAEVLTFNLLNAPTGMVIDSVTGLIQWTPNFNQAGAHGVTVQVSDEIGETDAQSFTINVVNTNRVPTIISTPITTGKQNEPYSYAVTATDPDNDPLTFSLITAPAGMVIDANTGLITWTPDTSGDIPITVTVDDGQGGTDTQNYTLSVESSVGQLPPDPSDVAPPNDLTVATQLFSSTAFLYSGANPIQTGVAPGTIEARRVAVLRGTVRTRDGAPLSGVTITILNHPEFGQTLSRVDGMFDLAVNGGGALTLDYSKDNFLSVQRTLSTPWRDYVIAPDVVLVPLDPQVTTVDLTAPVIQVARSSTSTDEDGTRQATLLFVPGTTATMILPDGTTQPLTTINVRATEYTVGPNGPEAMPALLPPTSGYTYAVELSVDEAIAAGAKEVTFNQSVIQYVENFLNFPVGGIVPVGFYDREKATWIPSDNGKVIQILNTTGGIAELDTNGDGIADDPPQLAALSITDAERSQLASLYAPNASLWRVPITHFTPWDYNWPYSPPSDAKGPEQPEPEGGDPEPDPCKQSGSIVECQNQILGERVPIVGAPFSLHYKSDRVPGRKAANTLNLQLSGPTIPASLNRIELNIEVAGRQFEQSFPAAPNQNHQFTWDGVDAYGRLTTGKQVASISIGYVYQAEYQMPANFSESFALFSGIPLGGNRTRQEITFFQNWIKYIGSEGVWDVRGQGLGGWSISVHHRYDPAGRLLHLGNGDRRVGHGSEASIITAFAGNISQPSGTGDGRPAVDATISLSSGVATSADGSVYIADIRANRIRRVAPDGIITTIAGTGVPGFSGDGGPATEARLNQPRRVAVASDGSIYFPDLQNFRVRRISPNGIITTVAGTGIRGFSGDGGPATQAQMSQITDVALGPDGSIYIADFDNHRIRRVSPDGIITTVAGSGPTGFQQGGFGGDGGPATHARLNNPQGVVVALDGNIYIADQLNNRIRRVSPDGLISTFAGSGPTGFNGGAFGGDGGPATKARLRIPSSVALGPDGSLYIGDAFRIRRVSPEGIIVTIAGSGSGSFVGNNGPATAAGHFPSSVAVAPDGTVYTAELNRGQIRKVSSTFSQFSLGDVLIPSEDGREIYVFTAEGRHLHTVNALTGETVHTFGYDATGLLITITDGDGDVTRIERDADGNPTAIVGPDGLLTALSLDANGYLASITNPANETFGMIYTADGLLTSFTNPLGATSMFSYGEFGRLTKDENAAGGFLSLVHSQLPNGFEVKQTSALGRTRTYRVDRLLTGDRQWSNIAPDGTQSQTLFKTDGTTVVTAADGTITTVQKGPDSRFDMKAPVPQNTTIKTPSGIINQSIAARNARLGDPNNLLSLQTQTDIVIANGKRWDTVYNAATREAVTTTPAGRQTRTTLDTQGRPTKLSVGGIAPIEFRYDPRGRLTVVNQGSGPTQRSTTLAYNTQGFVELLTDELNRTQLFTYDAAGRPTVQTLPDGREIHFTYDGNGNVTSVTPPGRPTHNFQYTPVDLEEQYSPPALTGIPNASTRYEYNLDKQPTGIIRPDGQTVAFAYDVGGRLGSIAPSTALGGATINYTYHPTKGFLESITTSDAETLTYINDGFLVTGESWGGSVAGQVTRAYNSDFQISGLSVNGTNILFGYDNDGLLTQAGNLVLTRDPQHGLVTASALGSVTTSQSYNSFGELGQFTASFGSTGSYDVQFTRDALGRITQKTETLPSELASTHNYGYDLAGRLTTVTKDGVSVAQYAYDANGNRLTKITPSGTVTGTYDDQDRLLTYGNNTYTYTANGELRTKAVSGQPQATNYDFDVFGNLRHVTLADGTSIDYVLDGRNRRIGKRINGVLVQGFLYQDQLNPVAELDGAGNVVTRFVYGSRSNVPDYLIKNGQSYHIITDQLGSPRLVINTQTGAVEQRLDYDEFGNITFDSSPGFQPFGFAGGIYDTHTKLIRFGARDYDPETGRWTAKDPIRFVGGDTNFYGYTINDPINLFDPNGLFCLPAGPARDALIGALSGAAGGAVTGAISGGLAGLAAGALVGGVAGGLTGVAGGFGGGLTEAGIGATIGGVAGAVKAVAGAGGGGGVIGGAVGGAIGGAPGGGIGGAIGGAIDAKGSSLSKVGKALKAGKGGLIGGLVSDLTEKALESLIPECKQDCP